MHSGRGYFYAPVTYNLHTGVGDCNMYLMPNNNLSSDPRALARALRDQTAKRDIDMRTVRYMCMAADLLEKLAPAKRCRYRRR